MWSVKLDTMAGLAGHLPPGTVHISQNLSPLPLDGPLLQQFRHLSFYVAVKVTANFELFASMGLLVNCSLPEGCATTQTFIA